MLALKLFFLAALVACAVADEEPKSPKESDRVRKDVLLGTIPYAYAAYPHVYDYGKYVAPVAHVPAVSYPAVQHVSTYSAVAGVPTYVHTPYAYSPYGAYKPAVVAY